MFMALVVKALYSVKEVAEMLGLHPNTVKYHIKRGNIASVKRGNKHFIPLSSLQADAAMWESLQLAEASK